MKAVSLRIRGRVQGVYFRGSAQDEAERLGISGFAQNDPDGSVAAFAQGEAAAVDEFIAWCRHGPSGAQVTSVDVHEESWREMKSFRVL
jgi:acylphosphatase